MDRILSVLIPALCRGKVAGNPKVSICGRFLTCMMGSSGPVGVCGEQGILKSIKMTDSWTSAGFGA